MRTMPTHRMDVIRARRPSIGLSVSSVQRDATPVADPPHPARERRIATDPLCQHIAPFALFFHQHPSCVRRRPRLQRKLPDDAVAFVNEISDGYVLAGE